MGTKVFGVNLVDAGYKPDDSPKVSQPMDAMHGKQYPSLYVSGKEMPAIKGLKAGDEMIFIAKVKIESYTETREESDKNKPEERCNATLRIMAGAFKPVPKAKSAGEMSEKEVEEKLKTGEYKEEE